MREKTVEVRKFRDLMQASHPDSSRRTDLLRHTLNSTVVKSRVELIQSGQRAANIDGQKSYGKHNCIAWSIWSC